MGFFNVFSGEKKRKEVGVAGRKTRAVKAEKAGKEVKKPEIVDVESSSVEEKPKKTRTSRAKTKNADKAATKAKAVVSELIAPYIAEKSTMLNEKGIYVFQIKPQVNKIMVRQFIKTNYKVDPIKVNIINLPGKAVFMRGKKGMKPGKKKAMVYLKEGDKINV